MRHHRVPCAPVAEAVELRRQPVFRLSTGRFFVEILSDPFFKGVKHRAYIEYDAMHTGA